jgi:hypothetical protein
MYTITINEGPVMASDNAVYFCNQEPQFKCVEVDCENERGELTGNARRIIFLTFVPTNGPRSRQLTTVPFDRVVSIQEKS